ncbi:MAG TPA: hypothetical protein VN704_00725 [Verrucomicrobiae bacterium]|nr:hypothetical protein [Verrucomicrobiae bacterium]
MNRRLILYSTFCVMISITIFFVSHYNIVYASFSTSNFFGNHFGNSPGNNFGNSPGNNFGNFFGNHFGNSLGNHDNRHDNDGKNRGNHDNRHDNDGKNRGNHDNRHDNGYTKFNSIFDVPTYTIPFNSNFADQFTNINKGSDRIPFP